MAALTEGVGVGFTQLRSDTESLDQVGVGEESATVADEVCALGEPVFALRPIGLRSAVREPR